MITSPKSRSTHKEEEEAKMNSNVSKYYLSTGRLYYRSHVSVTVGYVSGNAYGKITPPVSRLNSAVFAIFTFKFLFIK